jgi:hypothetical protein
MDEILIKLSIDGTTGNVSLEATDKNLQKIVDTVKKADQATRSMSDNFIGSFQNMRNLGQGAQQAWGMLEGVFGTGIKKALEYQLSLATLNGVIRSGGKDSQISAEQMAMTAERFEKSSMFDRDQILQVQRYFLTFKNIGASSIDEATQAAMGLTQVLGLDLRGATIALAKALDQGAEGMRALNKLGLKMSADEMEHIKTLEEEGKAYEMRSYVLSILASKYKDVNEEIQKTDAFKVKQAKDALQDAQRQAGEMQLLAVQPLVTGLSNMFNAFDKLPAPIKNGIMLTTELTMAYGILNATGIGATIKNLLMYDFGLRANKVAKLENIIMTKEMTVAEQAQTLAAYEAAVATKGFWASMGPIGWAVIGITALATVWGLLNDTVANSDKGWSEEEKELRKQQKEYKSLSAIIKDSTKSVQERGDATKKLSDNFPEYIGQSKLENLTEAEKNKILEHGNELFEERIKMRSREKLMQEASDELVKAEHDRDQKKKEKEEADKNNTGRKEETILSGYAADIKMTPGGVPSASSLANNALTDAQKKVDEAQKKFDSYKINENVNAEKPEVTAENLIKRVTDGLTNDAVDKIVKELGEINGKLVRGSDLSKRVQARIDELSKTRYGKTGGTGLEYLKEDTKMDLDALNQVKDMYSLIDTKWAAIDQMVVRNGKGVIDDFKTKSQQQKGRFKVREELEKSIDTLMKDKVKEAEVKTEAAGGDKIEIQEAKLKAMLQIMAEVEKQSAEWDKDPKKKEFPVISNQKKNEWKLDVQKQQNEEDKLRFDAGQRELNYDEEMISKRMEIENAGEMERLLLKESYLEKEIDLAVEFGQAEKVEELRHQLEMNDVDKENTAKRMIQRSRDAKYDIEISKANRGHDDYNAERLDEEKKYKDDHDKIEEDVLLTRKQKDDIETEMLQAHQEKLFEIKRKYYDVWLGQLAGLSQREIESMQKVLGQFEAGANSLMSMQQAKGQAEADSYRKTETDKLDIQKKAALAGARTDQQKQKIEDDFAKKKDKIDEEANKKGQERIKLAFALQKAAGIASAMVNTYTAAAAALAPPPMGAGPLMGPILAAMTIAAGLANVAAISAQEAPKFAVGGLPGVILGMMFRPKGLIEGPGSGTSDSIFARISNREFIVNAAATERHRNLLEIINANKFSGGGYAGGYSYSNSVNNILRNDNAELTRELQGLRTDMNTIMSRVSSLPVAIGDDECRRITSKGIGRMKRSKQ